MGAVLLAITIDRQGLPNDEIVLGSLSEARDRQAVQAVSQWRFLPARKDGRPVSFRATVEVEFLQSTASDVSSYDKEVMEQALATLVVRQRTPEFSDDSIHLVEALAQKGNAAATFVLGRWMLLGSPLPKDDAKGWENINTAVRKKDPSALRFAGDAFIEGKLVQQDVPKGVSYLERAANAGSAGAQLDLGTRYMDGNGLSADAKKAKKYLSMCAKAGNAECKKRLEKLSL